MIRALMNPGEFAFAVKIGVCLSIVLKLCMAIKQATNLHCPLGTLTQLNIVTRKAVICSTPAHCQPGYACVRTRESGQVFVCCKPTFTAYKMKHARQGQPAAEVTQIPPQCLGIKVPYFPFGSLLPLQCVSPVDGINANMGCPTIYKCEESTVPTRKICCLDPTLIGTITPPIDRTGGISVCPTGAPAVGNTGFPLVCEIENPVCPIGYMCTITTGAAACCPNFGTCGNNDAAYMVSAQSTPLTCTLAITMSVCPTGYDCQVSTTGYPLCCPNFGMCKDEEPPFIIPGQLTPILCQLTTTIGFCPRTHNCALSSTRTPVCCRSYGLCKDDSMPYIPPEQISPMLCDEANDNCPKSPVQYRCAASTTSWLVCCPPEHTSEGATAAGGTAVQPEGAAVTGASGAVPPQGGETANFAAWNPGNFPIDTSILMPPASVQGSMGQSPFEAAQGTVPAGMPPQAIPPIPGQTQAIPPIPGQTQAIPPIPGQSQAIPPIPGQMPGMGQPQLPIPVQSKGQVPGQLGSMASEVVCRNGAQPYTAPGTTVPVTCELMDTHCAMDTGQDFHCEEGPTETAPNLCCPFYGSCPGGISQPLTDGKLHTLLCSALGQQGVCPDGAGCIESTTGWIICCPEHGTCNGGAQPYYPVGQILPTACSSVDDEICPPSPRRYFCEIPHGSQEGICCPALGACPPGKIPLIMTPATTPLACPQGNECPVDQHAATCETSTLNDRICCVSLVDVEPIADRRRRKRPHSLYPHTRSHHYGAGRHSDPSRKLRSRHHRPESRSKAAGQQSFYNYNKRQSVAAIGSQRFVGISSQQGNPRATANLQQKHVLYSPLTSQLANSHTSAFLAGQQYNQPQARLLTLPGQYHNHHVPSLHSNSNSDTAINRPHELSAVFLTSSQTLPQSGHHTGH